VVDVNGVNKVYIASDMLCRMERRRYLALAGSGAAVFITGCIGGDDSGDDDNGGSPNDTDNGTDNTDNGNESNNNGTLPGYPSDGDNETDESG
jgi:hypothetical protein